MTPSLVSIAVCSNSVAPFVMVSDPMDALYGTDTDRVIKFRCFSLSEMLKGV